MPLSEEELRLLEQMERALLEEDPKFASTLRGTSFRRAARRNAILAGLVFIGGVAVLMAGVVTGLWVVGIVGFLVMLAAAMVGLTALRGKPLTSVAYGARASFSRGPVRGSGARGSGARGGSFMARIERRWDRRRGCYGW